VDFRSGPTCDVRVIFFSRGRGHGHATPDVAIADQLARVLPEIDLKFVSYGIGEATFHESLNQGSDGGGSEGYQFFSNFDC
jgi:hypothetical protein